MSFNSLNDFLSRGISTLKDGSVAVLLMEDMAETNSTIRHHVRRGFKNVIVIGSEDLQISPELHGQILQINYDLSADDAPLKALNAIIDAVAGRWMYYCYNAEYLFFPFCETRTVDEMLAFCSEERRDTVLTYVIDLYTDDLDANPTGVSLPGAHLDKSGYYAQTRFQGSKVMERQLDMFGGLRWRFEEHVNYYKRKIDRVGLFKAKKDLVLRADHTFDDEEYNTYACPWHNNITADICSFRAAKTLRSNPGSATEINTFKWYNSERFNWHSQQLMDLGLMEPGQWF